MATGIRRFLSPGVSVAAILLLAGTIGCTKKTDTTMTDSTATIDSSQTAAAANTSPDSMRSNQELSDANIMALLTEADSAEITEAKLMLSKTKNADVKAFANMMVTDHSKMLSGDHALAAKTNTTPQPPPQDPNPSELTSMLGQMSANSDLNNLDRMYASHAVDDHTKDLNALHGFEATAKNADLKSAIEKAIPIVQKHLDHAKSLTDKLSSAPAK